MISCFAFGDASELLNIDNDWTSVALTIDIAVNTAATITAGDNYPIVADFFSFGFKNSGVKSTERVANQIIRFELEETGDNTSTFIGTIEFRMVNQLNILDSATYDLDTIDDEPQFIVIEDLTDEDLVEVQLFRLHLVLRQLWQL